MDFKRFFLITINILFTSILFASSKEKIPIKPIELKIEQQKVLPKKVLRFVIKNKKIAQLIQDPLSGKLYLKGLHEGKTEATAEFVGDATIHQIPIIVRIKVTNKNKNKIKIKGWSDPKEEKELFDW